jgi:hypothetical protein
MPYLSIPNLQCIHYKYKYSVYSAYMEAVMPSSTMRINDDTKKDLVKVGAELSVQDGKERSLEDTVKFLIEHYKKSK